MFDGIIDPPKAPPGIANAAFGTPEPKVLTAGLAPTPAPATALAALGFGLGFPLPAAFPPR